MKGALTKGDARRLAADSGLRVVVVCGMTDKKLSQKLLPLQALPGIREILLVRRTPFEGEKIVNFSVPRLLRFNVVTVELWRFLAMLYLGIFRRPDVGICMTLIGHGLHVYLMKTLFGVPAVFHIMGNQDLGLHRPERKIRREFRWKFSLKADVVLTRGEATRQRFIEQGGMPGDRVFVQHNVFDFEGYRPGSSSGKEYDLLYVGYLAEYKSVDLLLHLTALIRRSGREVRFALAGDGPERDKLMQLSRQLGIEEDVFFLGHCEEKELIHVFQQSRIFVMTSLGEGLPQAMIEAMACGLPCALFDDADVREIIRPGENGVLVRPGDIEGLAAEVERLLKDRPYYDRISRGALGIHEEFASVFSVETQMGVWAEALRTVLR